MPAKTAAVIGATGLIGSQLIKILCNDDRFNTVRMIVRRPMTSPHPKAEVKLVNFAEPESVKLAIDGSDAVFCAIGTTQKKVKGDVAAYRRVDYDIPVMAARFCAETQGTGFYLVSSVGADSKSSNFYLRLKGEVEDNVRQLPIPSIGIVRPSLLLGSRNEFRLGEKVAQPLMRFFSFLLVGSWEKYRPIEAEDVAKAMVQLAMEQTPGVNSYTFESMIEKAALHKRQVSV